MVKQTEVRVLDADRVPDSPTVFAADRLGITPYEWQIEAMEAVAMGLPTSVVAANGSGKTARLVAPLVLWFLSRWPRGQVVVTSASARQIEHQLFPALRVFAHRFPEFRFLVRGLQTKKSGFAVGFTTDNPGRAEGWHPKIHPDVDPVFVVIDEAKTVTDQIFQAFDRCTLKFQLWTSSPGQPWGQFFRSFRDERSLYWTRRVPSTECPHIDPIKRRRDARKYGKSSALYRSIHEAEFTEEIDALVMTPQELSDALLAMPEREDGPWTIFCDFARGGDENVIAAVRGNTAWLVDCWRDKDSVQGARRFIRNFERIGLRQHCIWGDADGMGGGMVDVLKDEGWRINEFRGGMPANDKERFSNRITEVWVQAAREIMRGTFRLVGKWDGKPYADPILARQLTTRKVGWDNKGRRAIEPKPEMAKHGRPSPDRADGILGAIGCAISADTGFRGIDLDEMVVGGPGLGSGW